MPDNKGVGWRKKIQGKPKELQLGKTDGEDAASLDDSMDRRRHGWRITMPGSRPATPVNRGPTTPVTDDAEDNRSERSEAATTRPNHKPKLTRYTSLFSGFRETPKGLDFAEPWAEDIPPPIQPYIDPLVVVQSIRSHMLTHSLIPIPRSYNNGLFCVFEDYRKVRDLKEHLESALQDKIQELDRTVNFWTQEEHRYRAEIRRLELFIADSPNMDRVLNARQGSVVDRKRKNPNIDSNVEPSYVAKYMTPEQLDKEISLRCRNAFLRRPASPSSKMTVLSRQLAGTVGMDLHIGTPPDDEKKIATLSRKVQSELNLSRLNRIHSIAGSETSDFSSGRTGDALPDELSPTSPTTPDMGIECEALVALRELATLVARRRGVNTESFVRGLMALLAETEKEVPPHRSEHIGSDCKLQEETAVIPRRPVQRLQSQPHLGSIQQRSRNFSFEAGQDYLQALGEDLACSISEQPNDNSSCLECCTLEERHDTKSAMSFGEFANITGEPSFPYANKFSKIPSPVQPLGRVRRENSTSSMHSSIVRSNEEQRNSRSSVLTAFHNKLPENVQAGSGSRNSSRHSISPSCTEAKGRGTRHSSMAVIGAATALEQVSGAASPRGTDRARRGMNMPAASLSRVQTTCMWRNAPIDEESHDD